MVKRKFWGISFKGLTWASQYIVRISDTAGQEVYENVWLLAYPGTDIVIIARAYGPEKAYGYFETSAKENIGVTEALNVVFEAAEKVDEIKPTCICL